MKILVVDDEKDIRVLFLQRFRKEITTDVLNFFFAFSGEEALKTMQKMEHTALILSDINMPGMGGLELLTAIRTKYTNPSPIVMMITAYGDEENRNRAKRLGANDFLTKPLDFNLLKGKLISLIQYQK
jgi:CheY-like chemotaxis protein